KLARTATATSPTAYEATNICRPLRSLLRRCSELLTLLGKQDGEKLSRPRCAGVGRYCMKLPRSFQKHLAGRVGGLRSISDLRPDLPFEHVCNGDSRMMVRRRFLSGPVGDFHCRHRPAF